MKLFHQDYKHRYLSLSWFCTIFITILILSVQQVYAGDENNREPGTGQCATIEIFTASGCPHCARALDFLQQLQREYPWLEVHHFDVRKDIRAMERFIEINQQAGIKQPGVPTFLICGSFSTGFDNPDTTGKDIRLQLGVDKEAFSNEEGGGVEVPLLGTVSVSTLGLPLFTIIIGLVDGFNPCAMWVLLVLLSLLVNLRDRSRLFVIAGSFVFVSGLVYFAFMAAWLNLFFIIGVSRVIQVSVGLIAVLIGAVNIKDYFSFRKGLSLSIPDSAKPGIYQKMRRVVYAQNLFAALIAVIVLAVLVNLVELACTIGLPALYTQILAGRNLEPYQYYAYLLIYNLAYIFDDAVMVTVAIYTLSSHRLQESGGRWLKLISGLVILIIGALLIVAPEWLI